MKYVKISCPSYKLPCNFSRRDGSVIPKGTLCSYLMSQQTSSGVHYNMYYSSSYGLIATSEFFDDYICDCVVEFVCDGSDYVIEHEFSEALVIDKYSDKYKNLPLVHVCKIC